LNVAICDYGAGNIRSVQVALTRLGARVQVTSDPGEVWGAELAVLPGVGSAPAAMRALESNGLAGALRERFAAGRPILGICLGLHLALEGSEEDGGVDCLGLLPGRAIRLRNGRVPRIGWAAVDPGGEAFYFAHSYAAETEAATAHAEGLVAEARAGAFTGVQFHPEKSGAAGRRYLGRCLSGEAVSLRTSRPVIADGARAMPARLNAAS
jgi:imidazole glycerol phosphate synthase glutamine amidotransferase subunit